MARASRCVIFSLSLFTAIARADKTSKPVGQRATKDCAEFFEKQIRPILVQNCFQCHSGVPKKAKAGFVLDMQEGLRKGGKSGPVIDPSHPDHSLLIEAVRHESLEMPPKGKLPDELIDKLVRWVEMGAPDPRTGKAVHGVNKIDMAQAREFWAFQPPRAIVPPADKDSAWPLTDIDRFVCARQEAGRCRTAKESVPEGTSESRCGAPACGSLEFVRMGKNLKNNVGCPLFRPQCRGRVGKNLKNNVWMSPFPPPLFSAAMTVLH
jgi:hypothetical protein